jgi:hypothetical protein
VTRQIVTSADGQWAAIRIDHTVTLLDRPGTEAHAIELPTDQVDLAIPVPGGLLAILREPQPRVHLFTLPELEPAAAIELDAPFRIVASTGPRLVLGNGTHKFVIVRAAPRALAAQAIEPGAADFVAGMDKNQLLFGLSRKNEVWDAVSARPALRFQLQLPPPPRMVGTALGHLFVTRPGSDEVHVYRLSDGRPFRHHAGAPVERAIGHAGSPIVVLVTPRGLVRMNCFAHSLTMIDSPYTPASSLALHGTGDTVVLLGINETGDAWRVPLEAARSAAAEPVPMPAMDAPRPRPITSSPVSRTIANWRAPFVAAAPQLARGEAIELTIPEDSELEQLASRLELGPTSRRGLAILYALYLIGERPAIATLAALLADWREPLGHGELVSHTLIRRGGDGRIELHPAVSHFLDGSPPTPAS